LNDSGAYKFKPEKLILGNIERRGILEQYEKSNQRLEQEYGVKFSQEIPAQENGLPKEDPDLEYCVALIAAMSKKN